MFHELNWKSKNFIFLTLQYNLHNNLAGIVCKAKSEFEPRLPRLKVIWLITMQPNIYMTVYSAIYSGQMKNSGKLQQGRYRVVSMKREWAKGSALMQTTVKAEIGTAIWSCAQHCTLQRIIGCETGHTSHLCDCGHADACHTCVTFHYNHHHTPPHTDALNLFYHSFVWVGKKQLAWFTQS